MPHADKQPSAPPEGPVESKPAIPGVTTPGPASDPEPHSLAQAAQAWGMDSLPQQHSSGVKGLGPLPAVQLEQVMQPL